MLNGRKSWNNRWQLEQVREIGTKGTPIQLKPGDAIFYRGCKLEHWREPYQGNNHAQVFLHYNDNNGKFKRLYDMRPELGLPGCFRADFEDKQNKGD